VRPHFVSLPVELFQSVGERRARAAVALLRRLGLADFVMTDEVEKMRDYFHPA
jgi:hypothetical protein